ncbi:MAG: DNA primase [Chlamydiales bacterium]|nr:DNA primase [Chlamydiales bacterium]
MVLFTKESLELVRSRSNLVDVIASHVDLKKAGASFKALCPFHEEKSPSFVVQAGDSHYHCFGCGAHGDAIQFLMQHLKMSFMDAVEHLAERFQVPLQQVDQKEQKGPSKASLKDALEVACRFFHCMLLYTEEGKDVLSYLYKRGLDLNFIRTFQIGLSLKSYNLFRKTMHAFKFSDEILLEAGLLTLTKNNEKRDFFSDRIMFPIRNASGAVIGFSARKYKEETFGGKYINTIETPLFKKSYVLFGLNYSRKRITKERRAIIVEGQIDALRLIQEGFNFTVAGQGTAFGEGHVKELLQLGINTVYLALDSDTAGLDATMKVGHLFQKKGVEVFVIEMSHGKDPDAILKEGGPQAFLELMENCIDYLEFAIKYLSSNLNSTSPAGKAEMIQILSSRIREGENSVMVHETLRALSKRMQVPEEVLGVGQEYLPKLYIKRQESAGIASIDPYRVLEMDLLRWMLLFTDTYPIVMELVNRYVTSKHFRNDACRKIFQVYLENIAQNKPRDFLSLAIDLDNADAQGLMSEILQKKVNKEKIDKDLRDTIQKILEREWMLEREEIRVKIQSGTYSDEEVLRLVAHFDKLKNNLPKLG